MKSSVAGQAERRIVAALIGLTLFVSCIPYALGYFLAPVVGGGRGSFFIGTPYNIDDFCNYLSWLRQMADGHFFIHNLFTTDPQKDIEFNVFFWLLGRVMALTHCSPQAALQGARVGGGLALLWLVSRFYRFCLPADVPARLTALGFACLSGGLGWVEWARWQDKNLSGGPVDSWQPEAYTFLSVYTSALMTVSQVLILGALYALLLAERTGRWRYAVLAGVCGGILGNMHSYDVLHLSAAWGLFLVVWTVVKRGRGVARSWLRAGVALALTLPTTLYIFYMYKTEAVFQKRANVPTLSPGVLIHWQGHVLRFPAPWHYFLGYGFVFALAVLAGVLLVRRMIEEPTPVLEPTPAEDGDPSLGGKGEERSGEEKRAGREEGRASPAPTLAPPSFRGKGAGGLGSVGTSDASSRPLLFAACWAVAGLLVAYFPIAFQRKMLMGEHLPLCLLAGVGAAWLARRYAPRHQALALALVVLATAPSNVLFLVRDCRHLAFDKSETHLFPFLDESLVGVYSWVRDSTPPGAAVIGFPGLCTYLPGETGRSVWAGHWAETPHYGRKDSEFADAFDRATPDADRHTFLLNTRAQYLFYPNDVSQATFKRRGAVHQYVELTQAPPPYLRQTYRNDRFTVYEIR